MLCVFDSSTVTAWVTAVAALVAAAATMLYTVLFWLTFRFLKHQLDQMRQANALNAGLAVLKELHANEAYHARNYMMYDLPDSPDGLDESKIQAHLEKIRPAVMAFHTAGFLMKAGDIEEQLRKHVLAFIWATTWRCWKKSGKFIEYEAARRHDPSYMASFKELYELSDAYRRDQNLPEIPLDLAVSGLEPESQPLAKKGRSLPRQQPQVCQVVSWGIGSRRSFRCKWLSR